MFYGLRSEMAIESPLDLLLSRIYSYDEIQTELAQIQCKHIGHVTHKLFEPKMLTF